MARVIITNLLEHQINKKFKKESISIFELLYSLENNPKKGKLLGHIGSIAIKEIKYKSYRFYFVTDKYKIKLLDSSELNDLVIRFVRMSNKKEQQKVINEIKAILRNLGEQAF